MLFSLLYWNHTVEEGIETNAYTASCQNYQNGALMSVLIACDPSGNSAQGMYWLDLFTYIFISAMCICTNLV